MEEQFDESESILEDAWRPMTTNLGQGICFALEDAIVLPKKICTSHEL